MVNGNDMLGTLLEVAGDGDRPLALEAAIKDGEPGEAAVIAWEWAVRTCVMLGDGMAREGLTDDVIRKAATEAARQVDDDRMGDVTVIGIPPSGEGDG